MKALLGLFCTLSGHAFALMASYRRAFRVCKGLASTNDIDGGVDVNDDICRQTLSRALKKMRLISHESLPMSSMNKRRASSIEVRESSIPGAGLGLFAKKNIKTGTIISFYPAHSIGIEFGDESIDSRIVSIDASAITHERKHELNGVEANSRPSGQSYLHHVLGKRPLMNVDISQTLGGEAIYIDVDVTNHELCPCFVSHMVNDGSVVSSNAEDGVLAYYQQSLKAKNCVHVPFGPSPLLATVTTKKVHKGEEFFTTYGCSYWLEHLLEGTGEVETDMTEAIILQAKHVAEDVFKGMQALQLTNSDEAKELQIFFDTA